MNRVLLLTLLVLVIICFSIEAKTIKKTFISEVESELNRFKFDGEVFTEEDIAILPEPVQRYFKYCGYLGKEKMINAKIIFDDVDFKRGVNKSALKLKCEQYNFVVNPARIVYLKSRVLGIIPFEGRDKYQNGKGVMTGKLLKVVTLFDVTGPEMNQSALVTMLSEALFLPNYALQDYIKWEEIDDKHAKATLEYNGIKVGGIFTFNKKGKMLKFQTEDRYMDQGNGITKKEKWTAKIVDYVEKDGIKTPNRVKAIWNLDEGDFVYFDGRIKDITYNIK